MVWRSQGGEGGFDRKRCWVSGGRNDSGERRKKSNLSARTRVRKSRYKQMTVELKLELYSRL